MKSLDFRRSDRLSDQIKSEISFILKNESKDPRLEGLTILRVETSKDMKKAFIFFSPLNSFKQIDPKEVKEGLQNAKGFIRSSLGKRINIKHIPELFFQEDDIQIIK
tara:strand:- start:386 stop:706 length:321 start_codon:yes stop_codon:yes gene_type:complete